MWGRLQTGHVFSVMAGMAGFLEMGRGSLAARRARRNVRRRSTLDPLPGTLPAMSEYGWQHMMKLQAVGLCTQCASKSLKGKWRCADCLKLARERARKKFGYKPWKKEGPGRPPQDAAR